MLWHAPMIPLTICQMAGRPYKFKSTAKCAPQSAKNWQGYTWRYSWATMTLGPPAKLATAWRTTSTQLRGGLRLEHMFRPPSTALRTSWPPAMRQIVTYKGRGGILWPTRVIGNGRKTALPRTCARSLGDRRRAAAWPPSAQRPLTKSSPCPSSQGARHSCGKTGGRPASWPSLPNSAGMAWRPWSLSPPLPRRARAHAAGAGVGVFTRCGARAHSVGLLGAGAPEWPIRHSACAPPQGGRPERCPRGGSRRRNGGPAVPAPSAPPGTIPRPGPSPPRPAPRTF